MTPTTPDHDTAHERYEEWDAAYVLGALSPAERREFEEHLAGCESCRSAVAELAGMPGLLGRLPAEQAFALLSEPQSEGSTPDAPLSDAASLEPPAHLASSLAHAVRRRRRRTRGWVVTAFVAAAAVAAAAVVLPVALDRPPQPTAQAVLTQAVPNPLSASVELTSTQWGTSIEMSCRYDPGGALYASGGSYGLYVTDAAGVATRVSSWHASPGDTVRLTGSVDVPEKRIAGVEVRDEASGAVLLSSKL